MKKLIFSMLVVGSVFFAKAQDQKFSLGVGGALSSLSSSGGGSSSTGFGAEAQGLYNISETIQGFAQAGFQSFSNNGATTSYIPILVGAKYKMSGFKPGLAIGYGSFSTSVGGVSVSQSGFSYSPQIAYEFTEKLEVLAHYTSTSVTGGSYNILGLKVFYNIF